MYKVLIDNKVYKFENKSDARNFFNENWKKGGSIKMINPDKTVAAECDNNAGVGMIDLFQYLR